MKTIKNQSKFISFTIFTIEENQMLTTEWFHIGKWVGKMLNTCGAPTRADHLGTQPWESINHFPSKGLRAICVTWSWSWSWTCLWSWSWAELPCKAINRPTITTISIFQEFPHITNLIVIWSSPYYADIPIAVTYLLFGYPYYRDILIIGISL